MPYTQQDRLSFFRHAFLKQQPSRHAVMQDRQADRKYNDYQGQLNDGQIAAHLAGRMVYAVPYAENGLAALLAFDIDAGGMEAIQATMAACKRRALWSFGQYDPERERGYVYLPFDDLSNAERLRILGNEIIAEAGRDGWRIENRATNEDTRLPFARHRWTGHYGLLILANQQIEIDTSPNAALDQLISSYQENPTDRLPALPEPASRPESQRASRPAGKGYTIADFNHEHDLASLLDNYGAKQARGHGARLYFCPFHPDDHASLQISKDGQHCHCYSKQSECALSRYKGNDAFNVFCIGEKISRDQALRRLNGLPDDPDPKTGPQTPPAGPGRSEMPPRGNNIPPKTQSAPQRPAQQAQARDPDAIQRTWETLHARASLDDRLTRSDRRTLRAVMETRSAHGDACLSNAQYAQRAEISPRTAQYSLNRLVQLGYLACTERGKEGQTNIYRPAVAQVGDQGGAQKLAPTCDTRSCHTLESLGANRGGQADPAPAPQVSERSPALAIPEASPPTDEPPSIEPPASYQADAEGCYRGPGGAIVYPRAAGYVPPEAEAWYRGLLDLALPEFAELERPPRPEPAPYVPLPEPEPIRYGPPSDEARRRKYYGLLGKAKRASSPKQRMYLQAQARLLEEPLPASSRAATRPPAPPAARPARPGRAAQPAQLAMFDQAEAIPQRPRFDPDGPARSNYRRGRHQAGEVAPPSSSYQVESA